MEVWLSYSLQDFLLFSPRTYHRLIELYNRAIWPGQLAGLGLGALTLLLLLGDRPRRGRIVAAILAGCWLWVAIAFHWQRYATINWAAVYVAAGFALQAALLVWLGVVGDRLGSGRADAVGGAGIGLLVAALVAQPLVGLVAGRSWPQIELFGVAPDPTVVATLGILAAAARPPWLLLIIPLLWSVVSGATAVAMEAPDAWVVPAAAVAAVALAAWSTARPSSEPIAQPARSIRH